jgi:chromosome segregation ATPase
LEEQETLFQNMNMKEILNEEEKEKDESELRKVEELQEVIENVQAEKDTLGSKIELLIKDHKIELDNLVSELEEMEKIKKENEDLDNALKAKEAEKSNMLGVLQEKTRSHSQMKSENARLLQSISDLQNKLTEKDQEEMSKEAIHQLSKMVKDKDLEIEGLKSRNESLVTLVQNISSNEVIEALTKEKEDLLEKMNQESVTGKSVIDNSNEIIILKSKISDLEKKLSFAEVKVEMQDASLTLVNKDSRRRYHSESLDQEYSQELRIQIELLNKEKEEMLKQIQNKDELFAQTQEELRTFKRKSETIELHFNDNEKQLQDIKTDFEQCQTQLNSKSEEISKLKTKQDRLIVILELPLCFEAVPFDYFQNSNFFLQASFSIVRCYF